jgi:peptidoglycan/LPS O-acetylase OafA/YrhL
LKTERISALDGFRALAILPVVLFHFFSRWTPPLNQSNLYPYGSSYNDVVLFRYGYLGVEFFFVISGFVISMTLASSKGPWQFFAKRISRLWPAMLLGSSLTFLVSVCVPNPAFATHARNFLPSLLFMDPYVLGRIFRQQFDWMDGAYWSLFVEVRFYVWAALVFFSARTRFLEVFLGLSTAILALAFAADLGLLVILRNPLELLFFPEYLPWFTMGIGFYYLYARQDAAKLAHVATLGSLSVLALQVCVTRNIAAPQNSSVGIQLTVFVAVTAAFYAFVYKPRWVSFFAWRPVSMLGAASYSFYLVHQYLGVTLLQYLSRSLGVSGELVAACLIVLLAGMSMLAYRYYETPAKHLMLGVLLPARKATGPSLSGGHLEPAA